MQLTKRSVRAGCGRAVSPEHETCRNVQAEAKVVGLVEAKEMFTDVDEDQIDVEVVKKKFERMCHCRVFIEVASKAGEAVREERLMLCAPPKS